MEKIIFNAELHGRRWNRKQNTTFLTLEVPTTEQHNTYAIPADTNLEITIVPKEKRDSTVD